MSSKRPFCIFGITQSKINRLEWLLIHRIPKKCCISDLYPVHLNNVTTVPCEMQILCICIGTAFWTSCRKWPPQARRFCDVHNKCPSPVQRVMNRESWSTLRGCFFCDTTTTAASCLRTVGGGGVGRLNEKTTVGRGSHLSGDNPEQQCVINTVAVKDTRRHLSGFIHSVSSGFPW